MKTPKTRSVRRAAHRKHTGQRHAELQGALNRLRDADMVRPVTLSTDSEFSEQEYIFKHALLQDMAQSALLKQEHKRLHRLVAESYEKVYAGRSMDEFAALLAAHYAEAGEDRQALHYAGLAGDRAAAQYAMPEAIAHYSQAIEIALRLPDTDSRALADLYHRRGQAYYSTERQYEAWDKYIEMEEVARARHDRVLELYSLVEQATVRAILNPLHDPEKGRVLCERGLQLAQALGDGTAQARLLWVRMWLRAEMDTVHAVADGEQALALARELHLDELAAYVLNDLQYALRGIGHIRQAKDALAQAEQYWRAHGQLHMLADNLNQTAAILYYTGEHARGEALARETLALSAQTNNYPQLIVSHLTLALYETERGEIDRVLEHIEFARTHPSEWNVSYTTALNAQLYGDLGAPAAGLDMLESIASAVAGTPLERLFLNSYIARCVRLAIAAGDLPRAQAHYARIQAPDDLQMGAISNGSFAEILYAGLELALARNETALAEALLNEHSPSIQEAGLQLSLVQLYMYRGEIARRSDAPADAVAALLLASDLAAPMPARLLLWGIHAQLGGLYLAQNNPAQAVQNFRTARAVVNYIAARTPDTPQPDTGVNLRESFLKWTDTLLPISFADAHAP